MLVTLSPLILLGFVFFLHHIKHLLPSTVASTYSTTADKKKMASLRWYYRFCACISLMVGFEFGLVNGQYYRQVGSEKLPYQTFTVDQSGHGNFSTVQSAINAVPSNNKYWICIRVKAGTYRYYFCFTFLLLAVHV
jgi:hypothetical protein